MDELISIIVPVYNSESQLEKCINSIIYQTYKSLEIILIDDGSTDSSGNICDKYAKTDSRIKVYHQENTGASAARNKGIDMSTGKYITFVDSDDYIAENYISVLYSNMSSNIDLVISKPQAVNPDGRKSKYWPFDAKVPVELDTDDFRNMNWRYRHVWMAGVLYKKDTIDDLRFNTDYCVGEDVLFYFSAFKRCRRVRYIPEKLYYYVIYEESAFHGRFNNKKFTEFYAWTDICALYEDHPLHERFLENYELRCCRIYMSMLEAGLADDERVDDLISVIKANLKYGLHIHGYPSIYKRNFIWFTILPKPLHRVLYAFQSTCLKCRSFAVKAVKKFVKLIIRK